MCDGTFYIHIILRMSIIRKSWVDKFRTTIKSLSLFINALDTSIVVMELYKTHISHRTKLYVLKMS